MHEPAYTHTPIASLGGADPAASHTPGSNVFRIQLRYTLTLVQAHACALLLAARPIAAIEI